MIIRFLTMVCREKGITLDLDLRIRCGVELDMTENAVR